MATTHCLDLPEVFTHVVPIRNCKKPIKLIMSRNRDFFAQSLEAKDNVALIMYRKWRWFIMGGDKLKGKSIVHTVRVFTSTICV